MPILFDLEDSPIESSIAVTTDAEPTTSTSESTLQTAIQQLCRLIAPVWPLKDYVAVNPYMGLMEKSFLDARAELQTFSTCETLMPLSFYASELAAGRLQRSHVESAVSESNDDGASDSITTDQLISMLESLGKKAVADSSAESHQADRVRTFAEVASESSSINWSAAISDEVSKHLANHYDEGQAVWSSPWRTLPLFKAWKQAAKHDQNLDRLGLDGLQALIGGLPDDATASIAVSLDRLGVPHPLWGKFILTQAFSIPGWSAFAKYKGDEDLTALVAIRLAYDVAANECFDCRMDWATILATSQSTPASIETSAQYILLRASEIAWRDQVLGSMDPSETQTTKRSLAQMVFCIDVRSERLRRKIEATGSDIQTFGFAGFFAMPIEHVPLGQKSGLSHVPVLLQPQFQVHETLAKTGSSSENQVAKKNAIATRRDQRSWRQRWKDFQSSAVGCFSFVETTGLFFGWKLLRQSWAIGHSIDPAEDGIGDQHLRLDLDQLDEQGINLQQQVALAKGMLTNLGLTDQFARLVVFCGHASQTENNPLAAGLDCGACGGHSGQPNARLAAMLCNRPEVRAGLKVEGISIPDDTHFVAGVHETTTDTIEFFDTDSIPAEFQSEMNELIDRMAVAGEQTRTERLPVVGSTTMQGLLQRARDWSEVRPEWGLAGNAALIVAPRKMTQSFSLDGRSFLHSYEPSQDTEGQVLEVIMTAPMIVANWINMQYYASTVDNANFGSGNKTVHNVVGKFGILSGNSGDLQTGLPWQSLHTGTHYQHQPVRLLVIIAAPRERIDAIIAKHEMVSDLCSNGWVNLVAIEGDQHHRYTSSGTWKPVT